VPSSPSCAISNFSAFSEAAAGQARKHKEEDLASGH